MLGDAGAVGAKESVSFGRAVAGNDLEWLLSLQLIANHEQQIQKPCVDVFDFVCPMVTQNMVDLT